MLELCGAGKATASARKRRRAASPPAAAVVPRRAAGTDPTAGASSADVTYTYCDDEDDMRQLSADEPNVAALGVRVIAGPATGLVCRVGVKREGRTTFTMGSYASALGGAGDAALARVLAMTPSVNDDVNDADCVPSHVLVVVDTAGDDGVGEDQQTIYTVGCTRRPARRSSTTRSWRLSTSVARAHTTATALPPPRAASVSSRRSRADPSSSWATPP